MPGLGPGEALPSWPSGRAVFGTPTMSAPRDVIDRCFSSDVHGAAVVAVGTIRTAQLGAAIDLSGLS